MEFTARAATGTHDYPLLVDKTIEWHENVAEISIGEVPTDHIIVPSFSQTGPQSGAGAYTFSLTATDHHSVYLQRVPADSKSDASRGGSQTSVSTHIDCFHTHRNLADVRIRLNLTGGQPENALLTVTVRPLTIEAPLPNSEGVRLDTPTAISQMTGPEGIRQRICSPTATAMCLTTLKDGASGDYSGDWLEIVTACYDPVSQAYGSWPLAIRAANDAGIHGAVELISDWQLIHQVLVKGYPIVCSINFAAGELSGAPLNKTAGHLVVLYGFDSQSAWVMDPAAETNETVPRCYDIAQFSRAWLQQRGAAYIFSNHARTLLH